ncbi:hypothetical protein [Pseudonocardia kunmingensis]|nr:hypothetical protein [Pseudonocardia kunmingensis]
MPPATPPPPAFDDPDLELLLALYSDNRNPQRRLPWTWSVLTSTERAALARLIDAYSATFNHLYAITEDELIPPCWRRHPGLATELAVQLWLWYAAHRDPQATPLVAADYYLRHLPGFRARVTTLGAECRQGEHVEAWHRDVDDGIRRLDAPTDPTRDQHDLELLGALHFGFPTPTSDG